MAIFGFHFVLTLIAATVFNKVTSRVSLCEYTVIRGLYYYLLKGSLRANYKNLPSKEFKRRKKHSKIQQNEDDEHLVRIPLTLNALEGVPLISLFIWTFNYFIFAIIVYAISELFQFLFPLNQDRNISLTWIFCSLFFLIHVLGKLTLVKLSSEELHAERNLIVSFAAIFFLISMIFVMFSDNFMDVQFRKGYKIFVQLINNLLLSPEFQNVFGTNIKNIESHISPLLFLIILSILFTIISATFLFPNVQYASWYLDVSKECSKPLIRFMVHVTFFLPLVTFLFFTKPVKEHFLKTSRISEPAFDALRIVLVIVWTIFRCLTSKIHLQTFLNLPKTKIFELRQDSTLKAEDRQKKIAYYASYFCAAALQYFVPVFITLSTALLLKSCSNIKFSSLFNWSKINEENLNYSTKKSKNDLAYNLLQIFLSIDVQKSLWTLFLVAFLGIQSSLSLIGFIVKRIYLTPV